MVMRGLMILLLLVLSAVGVATAQDDLCAMLPGHAALRAALIDARAADNGGFGFQMWATIVNRDGIVCAVVFSGEQRGDQWPGSRVISAQKASTANAFSLPEFALSTANLFSAVQPDGPLFGLQESNPVNVAAAYAGEGWRFGRLNDPLVGERIGGVNVFGGGLALYAADGALLGGLGVSGDSSCADHNIAWRVRDALALDFVPEGVSPTGDDNIVYDLHVDDDGLIASASSWGHAECSSAATRIGEALPQILPIGSDQAQTGG